MRSIDKWLAGYVRSIWTRPGRVGGPLHIVFCLADHFEPFRGAASAADARRRVRAWADAYPPAAAGLTDADGRPPRHTFFYPAEDYDEGCLDILRELCAAGWGEVEVHLHHRGDTPQRLALRLAEFRDLLHRRHGFLGIDALGRARYAFVHGNWALCNSRPDGDWCGVNEELGVLRESGCYADFTFPSAPSPTQPRMVNVIYRATDTPGKPRGHDRGVVVKVGRPAPVDDGLMLITGPLALNWERRKWVLFPRLENAELTAVNPPTALRFRLWVEQRVHVRGRPDWVFVKVHTHGCVEDNAAMLLGETMRCARRSMLSAVGAWDARLHFVTAREMYNVVRAAEDGQAGDPGAYRDYEIGPPTCGSVGSQCMRSQVR